MPSKNWQKLLLELESVPLPKSPRAWESIEKFCLAMRLPRKRTVHEWAEAERVVPRGTSPKAGPWRSEPFQKPVLEAINNPLNTAGVLYVAASQRGGKTEIALNTVGYFIAHDPSPQIFVTYSVDMARKISRHRISRMIAESRVLRERVSEARSRDSGNTTLDKTYDGGELTLVGANSAGGLSMSPKRVVLFDEVDRYPASAGTEGDPVSLALTRTVAYWNAVKLYVTSPGIRETSRSWRLWGESDQREWTIDCPDCSHPQVPDWKLNVEWDKDEEGNHLPETARYVCRHCGSVLEERARWKACANGRYVAGKKFTGLAGFRISALGIAHVQLERLVRQWLAAQGNPEELKVFKNTVLAEWWDPEYKAVDEHKIMERAETFVPRNGRLEAPEPVALITGGVDVQDNRFEISVYGWGPGEESWCLGHEVLPGDPSDPAFWEDLGVWLEQPWPMARGGGIDYIRGVCVDTGGHHTQAAYDFCGARFRKATPDGGRRFIFATKGMAGAGELWPRQASKITQKVPLWPIRVDVGKEQTYGRLALMERGPGYMHFSTTMRKSFFDGLTSEQMEVTRHRRTGKEKRTWKLKKDNAKNEPLDCAVLAYAALLGLRSMGFDLEVEVGRLALRPVVMAPPPIAPAVVPVAPGESGRDRRQEPSWLGDTEGWLR